MSTRSRDEHPHDWTHYPVDHLAALLPDGQKAEARWEALKALREGHAIVLVLRGGWDPAGPGGRHPEGTPGACSAFLRPLDHHRPELLR
jgi:hypothetical protein